MGEGQFGILLLQRIGGEDVQADVLGVLLGQAAQAFTLFRDLRCSGRKSVVGLH